jgi:aminoglycoside phosphotransferase (APT) family kinase protein
METLGKVGFEVPTMHVLCEDNDVIGTPFYIMEFCEGRIVANTLEDVPKSDRKAAMFAMVRAN